MIDRRVLAAFFAARALGRRTVDFTRVLAANLAGSRWPMFVQFLVTARCNLACRYCELPPSRVPELSDSRIEALLDDLCACGMRKVSFTGGEPLLRDALPAWIRRVQSRGVFANLITNGWFLEDRAREIAGINLVMVSVDGQAEAHDSVRGSGSHERAIRGLQALTRRGVPVMISTVLHRENIGDIPWILDFAREVRAVAVFQPIEFAPGCRVSRASDLVLDADEWRHVCRTLASLKRAGAPIGYSRWFLDRAARGLRPTPCHLVGRLFCSILPDGRVMPCNVLLGLAERLEWPNALRFGVREAIRRLPPVTCDGCSAGYQELDAMLSFRLWELR